MRIILLIIFYFYAVFAQAETISLEFKQADLSQALRSLAAVAKINVMISEKVTGKTSLKLINTDAYQAFLFLLRTNNLSYVRQDSLWYIATPEVIQQLKQSQPLLERSWKLRFARAADIAKVLQDGKNIISERGQIKIDERTNLLFVADSAENMHRVEALLARLDVPVKQVQIEVRIVSMDTDCAQELGLSFQTYHSGVEVQTGTGIFSVELAELGEHVLLDAKLSALESSGRAEVLSSPKLFTANLQAASIESGQEIPYQHASSSGATAVEFKKAVLGFKVTPQILPDERMLLSIKINQDRPTNKLVLGVPTINTRQLETNILAKSGQTIVLGGIYELNSEKSEQGVPGLAEVPVLGWMFKERTRHMAKRELMIFVKPKIL